MKHFYHIICIVSLLLLHLPAQAQQDSEAQIPQDLLDDIFTQIAENADAEEIDQTQLYEDLMFYLQNPINLNAADRQDLQRLQFLNDVQIDNLLTYVRQYGPMQSLYELQLVDGFSEQDVRNLLPFVSLQPVEKKQPRMKFKNVFKYGRHEILTRADRGVETKEGYQFLPEEELQEKPNSRYMGDPFYYSLRYRFNYSRRVQFGFTGEKDAGEQAWGQHNKVFDFYSAHLQLNDIWKFKTIVLGDFSASFGQGLIINTNYGFGKSSMALNVATREEGLRKYGSADEYNFLRGAGATIQLGKFDITAFYSLKKIDGDTVAGVFASIKKDGLHRTESDMYKKRNVTMQVMGAHVGYTGSIFRVGATAINTQLDHTLTPAARLYNRFYFSGNEQSAVSLDYQLRWRRFHFFGETALSWQSGNTFIPGEKSTFPNNNKMRGAATINGLTINPASGVSLVVLHRYYAKDYDMIFASAFGESSRANNENGLYVAAEVTPFKYWKFTAYADMYRFPYLKNGINKPSNGWDALLQADFSPSRSLSMFGRLRYEQKQANITNDAVPTYVTGDFDKASLRYRLNYNITDNLRLRNTIEFSYAKTGTADAGWGRLINQELSYKFNNFPLSFDLAYTFFDTDVWDNRIYIYERDVLYAFSIPALAGKGSRYYLNIKYSPIPQIAIYFKIAQTAYIDRDEISSSLEKIDGNRKTDLRLLVRWKF